MYAPRVNSRPSFMNADRMKTMVDAIYAFSLTLLVVTIDIPKGGEVSTSAEFYQRVVELIPQILTYALSFLLLAIFWITNHKEYNLIRRVDSKFLWLNFLSFIFVIFIPFTTDLMGEYPLFRMSGIIFDINILAVGLTYYGIWAYAEKKNLLAGALHPSGRKELRWRLLIIPVLALIAIGLSFVWPGYSNFVCLSAPFIMWIIDAKYDTELKEDESDTPERNKN